jgi:hypothetical protein
VAVYSTLTDVSEAVHTVRHYSIHTSDVIAEWPQLAHDIASVMYRCIANATAAVSIHATAVTT